MLELDKIYNMDCIEGLKQLGSASIDTIITDPPYGLRFMGKKWDYNVPSVDIWKECLRVLKPGGTALVFAGSRTQHRMAVNVEDAGFILKDCIMWIYGSGFPKATDISKQLDKIAGAERERLAPKPYTSDKSIQGNNYNAGGYERIQEYVTAPTSPEAKLWNGWKSHGLKPAYEPILVAMKPNDGSYANNALVWGVSGLNIDGGRIPTDEKLSIGSNKRSNTVINFGMKDNKDAQAQNPQGRYPSNVILDEVSADMLDDQSGMLKSGKLTGNEPSKSTTNIYGEFKKRSLKTIADKGGASRFFYCAKASKSERNMGCNSLEEKEVGHNRFDKCANCGKYIFQNPDRKSACKCKNPVRQHSKVKGNFHPTVKPLSLMEYLCNLTKTPSGGVVLDPFIGSGTTAVACRKVNRHFIGFEINPDYVEIANKRLMNMPKCLEYFV